jgi:N-acetylated-alpha-linked acidic dipeptidase
MAKDSVDANRLHDLNESLMRTERVLTRPEGLPNREWYKHQIYAPGLYTGYGVKTLPGIREAVDNKDWTLAGKEAGIVEQCLTQMNQVVSQAINQLSAL